MNCIKKKARQIRDNPGGYCLCDKNLNDNQRHCTTFVLEVLKDCGLSLSIPEGGYIEPADLINYPDTVTRD